MGETSRDTASAGSSSPIDHAHLARYTLGNRLLEIEVLQLFADQAPLTLADLAAAETQKAWHIAAHTLKGSARAVGAWAIGNAAEAAERAGPDDSGRTAMIRQLDQLVAATRRYIDGLAQAA